MSRIVIFVALFSMLGCLKEEPASVEQSGTKKPESSTTKAAPAQPETGSKTPQNLIPQSPAHQEKNETLKIIGLTMLPVIENQLAAAKGINSLGMGDSVEEILDGKKFEDIFQLQETVKQFSMKDLEDLSIPKLYKQIAGKEFFTSDVIGIYIFPAYRRDSYKSFDLSASTRNPNFIHYHRWWSSLSEQKSLFENNNYKKGQINDPGTEENLYRWITNNNASPLTKNIYVVFMMMRLKPKVNLDDFLQNIFNSYLKAHFKIDSYVME